MSQTKEKVTPRDTINIASHRDFARMVKIIAEHRNIAMSDVLDLYAMPAITKEYRKCYSEMAELGGES